MQKYRAGEFSKENNTCMADWCDKPARGSRGMSKLCNGCYTRYLIYDITLEEYLNMPHACEVCSSTHRLSIDHDHETGNVRGLLCHGCNIAIGSVYENKETLLKLIKYLER